MKHFIALMSGFIFGLGLGFSGLMNPAKVLNFLDVTGHWDPSLMFVMMGGILVSSLGVLISKKRTQPICESNFSIPQTKTIDQKLIIGSLLFGIGWGLAGICPGPAFANLFSSIEIVLFIVSMLIGMKLTVIFRLE